MRIPIASDGWRFIVPALFLGAVVLALPIEELHWLGAICFLFAAACAGFFRDFNRDTPADDNLIYSPGDGRILEVGLVGEGPRRDWRIIRIFLSVLDGHVQRSPVRGKVTDVTHQKGLFLDARDPEAHVRNEQNSVFIDSTMGTVVVTQIAGLIARRIVCWIKPGALLGQGERYGLIRFGSQVDVLLPASTIVSVNVGESVIGGRTVLARWKN